MAMSLPLVTSGGVRQWRAASNGGAFPERDLTALSMWPHQGSRLWASMSDAFWVYEFKVQRCQQLRSHDWTLCPYAHRGERARRRDPRRYPYLGVACPEYRTSHRYHLAERTGEEPTCVRGLTCRYAHGVFEEWLHPDSFRTRMCNVGPRCQRRICFFAHYPSELRSEGSAVPFVGVAMVPPPIQYPPPSPPAPRPRLRIVNALDSSLPRCDMVLQTRSGDKLPLTGGNKGAASSSSTASVATPVDINGSSSAGSSSSGGSRRAVQDSDSEDDISDLDFFIVDMVNKLVT